MGPTFGNGVLTATQSFNRDKGCWSNANEFAYRIGMDSEGINMLTNLKCQKHGSFDESEFKISELEVWEIIFEK